jgi:phage tail-like protein
MDANGTRYHLLLGERDFASRRDVGQPIGARGEVAPGPGLVFDAERGELTLRPERFRFVASKGDRPVTLEDRRGAAADRYGNWYWIDDDRQTIRVQSSHGGPASVLWPVPAAPGSVPDGEFRPAASAETAPAPPLAGLTVTAHHYLVAGSLAPAGLLIFDLHAGGPPMTLLWPAGVPFDPFDLAARSDGGLFVLDTRGRRLWHLDRRFGIVPRLPPSPLPAPPSDFGPVGAAPSRTAQGPGPVTLADAWPLADSQPISVEALPDGSALVLDRPDDVGPSQVRRYQDGAPTGVWALWLTDDGASPAPLVAHDMVFVEADAVMGNLFVSSANGNQSFAFRVFADGSLRARPELDYYPMRLHAGKALAASGRVPSYDFSGGFVPLVAQRQARYLREATMVTRVFDGKEPGCVWHRLFLDVCLPAGAAIEVASRAADEEAELSTAAFLPEPTPRRRREGAELPALAAEGRGQEETYETLFQRARGRFLELRLTFRGNGATSPHLRSLRVYYPRFSYLERYLPAVYREDRDSASFLDRFLANVEGTLTVLEDKIASVQLLLDPRTAPPGALDWLASWLGVVFDAGWDERRRRLFLGHAMTFFQARGTMRGLAMALRLALDDQPDESIFDCTCDVSRQPIRIVERFRARGLSPAALGDPSPGPELQALPVDAPWTLTQPGSVLSAQFRQAMVAASVPVDAQAVFPTVAPADAAAREVWRLVAGSTLGFVPSAAGHSDQRAFQEFLARRYRTVDRMNAAHGTSVQTFAAVTLPTTLPGDGAPLRDWYQFEATVLPLRRSAHQFTVVLPVPPGRSASEQAAKVDRARLVIEREKPTHTVFDLKFYWNMFRVGEARLGLDTLVDLGGRAPELTPPFVLDSGRLAEGYLAPRPPQDAALTERFVVGATGIVESTEHRSDT